MAHAFDKTTFDNDKARRGQVRAAQARLQQIENLPANANEQVLKQSVRELAENQRMLISLVASD